MFNHHWDKLGHAILTIAMYMIIKSGGKPYLMIQPNNRQELYIL